MDIFIRHIADLIASGQIVAAAEKSGLQLL